MIKIHSSNYSTTSIFQIEQCILSLHKIIRDVQWPEIQTEHAVIYSLQSETAAQVLSHYILYPCVITTYSL